MGNGIFWSEIGSGFGDAGGTPPPKIPRSTPTPPGSWPHCEFVIYSYKMNANEDMKDHIFKLQRKISIMIDQGFVQSLHSLAVEAI